MLLLALALLLVAAPADAVSINLTRYGYTVAGTLSSRGSVDGTPGVSRFQNPFALCGSHNATDTDDLEFLISDNYRMRIFTRASTTLSTWFDNGGTGSSVDGPLSTSDASVAVGTISNVMGCHKYRYNSSMVFTFFVTQKNTIRYIFNDYIYTYTYTENTGLQFTSVTTYGTSRLYALSTTNSVLSCTLSTTSPYISACSILTLSSVASSSIIKGIAPTSTGFLITTGSTINLYVVAGTSASLEASVSGAFLDVQQAPNGIYFAVTSSAIYRLVVGSTTLAAYVHAGTESDSCSPSTNNVDGLEPTYCGIQRILPYSANEIYVALPGQYVLRSLILPPVQVPIFFGRLPFPIGFVDESAILPTLIADINAALNSSVNAGNTSMQQIYYPYLDESTGVVDTTTWNTNYMVLVPQQAFDNALTVDQIWAADYSATLSALNAYYSRTNEVYYGDNNVMPVANRTKQFLVEQRIAAYARSQLGYALIYTGKTFQTSAVNVSGVKVLMPASYGTTANHALLFPSDSAVKAMLLQAVRDSYPSSSKYNVSFSGDTYNFARLDDEQTMEARWWIQRFVMQRVRSCAASDSNPSGDGSTMVVNGGSSETSVTGIGGGNGPELTAVPIVGITNQTVAAGVGSSYSTYNYELFLPEGYNFTGTKFSACMNATDWSTFVVWINAQPTKAKKTCNTGCIVGIAVASAVVACILIAVIVVVTSKRRRLATVVVPTENGVARPKFSSTVDLDEEASSNPFAA
ncbi:beta-glucosidase Adg3 (putative) [Strigomonas culicis]|uniref:Beta-glucosidase Adg3 (Putative) n=1 Tax=Strigomonas culicis TaxID=28005 RepID=S9VQ86_9TRYP|nr:beta-glucosidase Adg3 (putative) [Strigomonas culicis]|eukprot:EPY29251.1 beta-glucosidase Adg3 (putative) [Strigomonas culicis]